jgi:hypothetical protein
MGRRLPRFHSAEIQTTRPLAERFDGCEPAVVVWVEKAEGPDGQDYTLEVCEAIARALVPSRSGGAR